MTFPKLFVLAVVLAISANAWSKKSAVDDLQFEVLLDGKPIGFHHFRIIDGVDARTIEVNAEFDVRVLFVPVYRYRHSNTEVWQDGCLARIESQTDSNGKLFAVSGQRGSDNYNIKTGSVSQSYPLDCLMSFAYWDREILQQELLLNAQTGEVIGVEIQSLGEQRLDLADREVVAEVYRIVSIAEGIDIKLWYAASSGRWLSLESRLENGRLMRYLPLADAQLARHDVDSISERR